MELVVVSQKWCRPCVDVKNYLKDNDVAFIEFNISDLETVEVGGVAQTRETLSVMSTPVTILFDGDEEIGRVAGSNLEDIQVLVDQL